MTPDEEIAILEDSIRKLKVEFDMYFGGGVKRPPYDAQWRVESILKRLEGSRLSFPQRFKLNAMQQKYAVYADMWRQKVKRKEEGTEGPRGRRVDVPEPPPPPPPPMTPGRGAAPPSFKVQWTDPDQDHEKVGQLFEALVAAKKRVGENPDTINMDGFKRFVKQKTEQLKRDQRCQNVEYIVEVENGKVSLKAKGA
jgi:hypothetical protein